MNPPQRPLKPGFARKPPDEPAALPVPWPSGLGLGPRAGSPTGHPPARPPAASMAHTGRPSQDTMPSAETCRPTFSFCPFLFFPRPWRLLDLVPELLLLTAGLGWVFFLPSTFLRLPAKRTARVCASRVPMAYAKGAPAKALQVENQRQHPRVTSEGTNPTARAGVRDLALHHGGLIGDKRTMAHFHGHPANPAFRPILPPWSCQGCSVGGAAGQVPKL